MIHDDTCTDTMIYNVIYENHKSSNGKELPLFKLTEEDKELLIEYAPKIFNTYNGKNLEDVMKETAILLHNYRNKQSENKIINFFFSDAKVMYEKQKEDKRHEAFKKHIISAYRLLGNDAIGTPKGNELKNELQNILENVLNNKDEYFIKKPKVTATKKDIEKFLNSLKLSGKSKIIQEFIKEIE
jgi:hypothetical protein